ncbi:uncharacterized protein LOC143079850 [Mytilus galloprovincialis]|uniref:uncharacterized protein LOC143079850 n=1 Tax=Mytilus galloprovincialis TaxID=29158 RepID=UPI003F7C7BB4
MVLKILKAEFCFKKLGFGDVHPGRFVYSQWRLPPLVYLLYRLALAAYADYWIIETGTMMESMRWQNTSTLTNSSSRMLIEYSFPVYLTNWTYLMLCLYLTLHFLFALFHYCIKFRTSNMLSRPHAEGHRALFNELTLTPTFWDEDRDSEETEDAIVKLYSLPWYFKLTWIFYTIATTASVMVTFMFFAFLWPQFDHSKGIDIINLQLHGINSVIVVVDLLISAVPVRLLHAVYAIIYGLIYITFTGIFFAAGNRSPIYPHVLDWRQPAITTGVVVGVAVIAVPIVHLVLFGIHRIKVQIYHKITPWSTL